MFGLKKSLLWLGMITLLFSGCGGSEMTQEGQKREVSSQVQGLGLKYQLEAIGLKESGVEYEDTVIEFQDSVMEEMLRNMIGKTEGDVFISDLQKIHSITFSYDYNIGWDAFPTYGSNLQKEAEEDFFLIEINEDETLTVPESFIDLAYCYNLQEITFCGAELSSLKGLCDLPQLEILEFERCVVTEEVLEDIGNTSSLRYLFISHREFTDWGYLTDGSFLLPIADKLKRLCAEGNIDWNPDVLVQMTNLECLSMEYTDDLSFLEQMPNLKRLDLYCCCPSDWTPLASLENLEDLYISGNMYTTVEIDLEDLTPLKNLKYLDINAYTTVGQKNSWQEIVDAIPSLTGLYVF